MINRLFLAGHISVRNTSYSLPPPTASTLSASGSTALALPPGTPSDVAPNNSAMSRIAEAEAIILEQMAEAAKQLAVDPNWLCSAAKKEKALAKVLAALKCLPSEAAHSTAPAVGTPTVSPPASGPSSSTPGGGTTGSSTATGTLGTPIGPTAPSQPATTISLSPDMLLGDKLSGFVDLGSIAPAQVTWATRPVASVLATGDPDSGGIILFSQDGESWARGLTQFLEAGIAEVFVKAVQPGPIAVQVFVESELDSGLKADLICTVHDPDAGGEGDQEPLQESTRGADDHGAPKPNPSPTGEGEADRTPNQTTVDMYSLAPSYAMSDMIVGIEGEELKLELRRTSGIRSRRYSSPTRGGELIYPPSSIFGPGWDTNLSCHIIVRKKTNERGTFYQGATVTDELGNTFSYIDLGNSFSPDTTHSFNNDGVRAKLIRVDDRTLRLHRVHGTILTFTEVDTFPAPGSSANLSMAERYYRLDSVTDRNGNTLQYEYLGTEGAERMLVRRIYEVAHPERQMTFRYKYLGEEGQFLDPGWRLTSATDPLGRQVVYDYDDNSSIPYRPLISITRESFDHPVKGPTKPITRFAYYVQDLADVTRDPTKPPSSQRTGFTRSIALSQVVDARGHVTSLTYVPEWYPTAIKKYMRTPVYKERLRVQTITTVDGTAIYNTIRTNGTLERSPFRVVTEAIDTRGTKTIYDFTSLTKEAPTTIGGAIYMTRLERTTTMVTGDQRVIFEWGPDPNRNLLRVIDMNDRVTEYEYTSGEAGDRFDQPVDPGQAHDAVKNPRRYQAFNKPARRRVDVTGLNLVTEYRYEPEFNKAISTTDAEGRTTTFAIDPANGNRLAVYEPLGRTTRFEFESDGYVKKTIDPDNRVTTFSRLFSAADLEAYCTETVNVVGYDGQAPLNLETVTVSDVMRWPREYRDARGNVTLNRYDALYRLIKTTEPAVENPRDPAGPLVTSDIQTWYDEAGNRVRVVDGEGNVTIYEHDLMSRLRSTRIRMSDPRQDSPDDIVTRQTYNALSAIASQTDGRGAVTDFVYDELLRLVLQVDPEVTLPDGSTTRYETRMEYGPLAGPGAFTPLSNWNPTRTINARGFARDAVYDGAYRLIAEIQRIDNGAGIVSTTPPRDGEPCVETAYDRTHHEIVETVWNEGISGAEENQSTYTFYDELYRETVVVVDMDGGGPGLAPGTFINDAKTFLAHPRDLVQRTIYDQSGNVLEALDAEGNRTTHEYDGSGRKIRTELEEVDIFDPDNRNRSGRIRPATHFYYDPNGNLEITEDPNHIKTKVFHDARDRIVKTVVDMIGDGAFGEGPNTPNIVTSTHYDLADNVIRVVDGRGNATHIELDRAYREERLIQPAVADAENGGTVTNPVAQTVYDKNSNITRVVDPRGVVTDTEFDELNRERRIIAARDTSVEVISESEYDANDNIVARILHNDNGPQRTTSDYDPLDRMVHETLADINDGITRKTTHHYSRNGNVVVVRDPKGQEVSSEYDRANRLTIQRFVRADGNSEEVRVTRYDRVGNPIEVTDAHGTSIYEHDALYRTRKEVRRTQGQPAYTVESAYDAYGNRTMVVYPGGRTIEHRYDPKHRLLTVDDGGRVTTYSYDPNNNRETCKTPNNVETISTFDALNRVATITSTGTASDVYKVTFDYDLVGNRREASESLTLSGSRVVRYEYDEQYRLTAESSGNRRAEYVYDKAGNRTNERITINGGVSTVAYVHDALNRLTSRSGDGPTVTYKYDANGNLTAKTVGDVNTSYHWDVSDRLLSVDVGDDGQPDFMATYDYRTRRIETSESGTTTVFRYDGGVCCQEIAGDTVESEFIRGTGQGGGIGSILYRRRTANVEETFVYNAVGHTVALTNELGETFSSNVYLAFGKIASSGGVDSPNDRLANTKERSTVAKLDNHGFRYYDYETGRYISPDPLGHSQGLNYYIYCRNNPVNHVDPVGLGWTDWLPSLDTVQTALDVASMVPALGTVTSVVNAGISVARGDFAGAALNVVAAIPGAGTAIKGGKLVTKAVVAATKVAKAVDKVNDVRGKIEGAVEMVDAVRSGDVTTIATTMGSAALGRRSKGNVSRKPHRSEGGAPSKSKAATQGTPCKDPKEKCFVAGTLVMLADGRLVPIEELEIGARVFTDESLSDSTDSVLTSQAVVQVDLVPLDSDDRDYRITLLRDASWFDREVKSDQIYVELDRLGIRGWSCVDRIVRFDLPQGLMAGRVVTTMARYTEEELVEITLEDDSTIRVTAEHPFRVATRDEWVVAGELEAYDKLLSTDGSQVAVQNITIVRAGSFVHNIEVDVAHHYFVSQSKVASHNYPNSDTGGNEGGFLQGEAEFGPYSAKKQDAPNEYGQYMFRDKTTQKVYHGKAERQTLKKRIGQYEKSSHHPEISKGIEEGTIELAWRRSSKPALSEAQGISGGDTVRQGLNRQHERKPLRTPTTGPQEETRRLFNKRFPGASGE